MKPEEITAAFAAAQEEFIPVKGKLADDDLVRLTDTLGKVLLDIPWDRIAGKHSLYGCALSPDRYLARYGAKFARPVARPVYYDPNLDPAATPVKRSRAETAWTAQIQD